MQTNQILHTEVLDIIFEGRNKMYGAYELRKSYNKRLKTAMSVMIGCCVFAFLAAFAGKDSHHPVVLLTDNEVHLTKIEEIQQPIIPPPPLLSPPPAPKPIATIKFSTPVLSNSVDVPPPAQIDMDNIAIGTINKTGDITDVVNPPVEPQSTGTVTAPRIDDFKGEVFFVQKEAQFPGGPDAWKRFLERHLKAELPADNGAPSGVYRVTVSFLVDKDGNISEVKAENDPGYGTAAEAVRAIQNGPRWTPATQNGRNVIYRQKQIITFKVDEAQ